MNPIVWAVQLWNEVIEMIRGDIKATGLETIKQQDEELASMSPQRLHKFFQEPADNAESLLQPINMDINDGALLNLGFDLCMECSKCVSTECMICIKLKTNNTLYCQELRIFDTVDTIAWTLYVYTQTLKILLGLHQVGLGPLKVDKLRGYPTCHKTDFLQAWAQKWIK